MPIMYNIGDTCR